MKTKISIIFIIFLFIPQIALAGVISLTTTVSSDEMIKDSTKINVKLLNSGTEPAYSVQITPLLSSSFSADSVIYEILSTNEPKESSLKITLNEEVTPGNYPAAILVDYADANGYPFSSVSPNFIVYKTRTVSRVSGIMSEVSLTDKSSKKMTLTVRNLDDSPHDVKIKLFLPRELKVENSEKSISLNAKEEKELSFEVSSLSALAGSSYISLASLEYEDEVLHYSSFARGIIKIEAGNPFEFPIWVPVITFVVLLIIFLYYFKRGKK